MKDLRFDVSREKDPRKIRADLLVLPVTEEDMKSRALKDLDAGIGKGLLEHVKDAGFRGQAERGLLHRPASGSSARAIYLAGLGAAGKATGESWRRAGGAAARTARGNGASRVAGFFLSGGKDEAAAWAEGFALGNYSFDRYRKPPKEKPSRPERLTLAGPGLDGRGLTTILDRLKTTAECVFAARDLVNEPPSQKTPAMLAKEVERFCRGRNVRVEVMGPRKIRSMRLAGLLAVNRGSEEEPRFIRLQYKPRGKPRKKIALIGKGITFDSGGLSLKPPKSMETMKLDMAGAATVLGVMAAIGKLKPRVQVTGYIAATENLPGGRAQKPGDVIRYRNGKSVEVLNTDAEGRLVLADALALASEEKHDVVIDFATLTGACLIALGPNVAGVMGNDESLVRSLIEHGRQTGEALWELPLVADYRSMLDSKVADLKNVGSGPQAGTITAGLFLKEFVDGPEWAHFDIAGPAFSEKDLPYCPTGGTGFGIRTIVRYLMEL